MINPETVHLLNTFYMPLYAIILMLGLIIWLAFNFKLIHTSSKKQLIKFLTSTMLTVCFAAFIPHLTFHILKLFTNYKPQKINIEINKIITDNLLPISCLIIILGVITGLIKNWNVIKDANSSSRRKEGIISVGFTIVYFVISVLAVIGLCCTFI